MAFNLFVVALALAVGGASGAAGAGRERSLEWRQLVVALAVGVVASFGAVLVTILVAGRDMFAVAHTVYVILTIGVPLAAAIMLWRSSEGAPVRRALLAVGLLGVPLGIYATHIEPFWLRVDEVRLASSPELAGLRLGVLADFQTDEVGSYEQDAIATLLAAEPDVVLIAGDFWQMSPRDFRARAPEFAAVLSELAAGADHVIAVHGDADNLGGLEELAAGTGVVVLDNDTTDVETRGMRVRIAGLSIGGDRARRATAIGELSDAPAGTARVLLAHKPDVVYEIPDGGEVDVVVAGHTHGGQVQIPFFGPVVTLSSVPRGAAAGGLHRIDGHAVYVSTGVGREKFKAPQVRFGARPSVGLIELYDPALPQQ